MRFVCFLITCMAAISCTWNSIPDPAPPQRDPINIDLNSDGVRDATLYYSTGIWDGVDGTSGSTCGAVVRTEAYNTILNKRDAQMTPRTLFHVKMDTIHKDVGLPQEWINSSLPLVEIFQQANGKWPKTWTVKSQHPSGPYYLGMKIRKGNSYLIGWIRLSIEANTGEVTLVDKGFTENDFIVIDR